MFFLLNTLHVECNSSQYEYNSVCYENCWNVPNIYNLKPYVNDTVRKCVPSCRDLGLVVMSQYMCGEKCEVNYQPINSTDDIWCQWMLCENTYLYDGKCNQNCSKITLQTPQDLFQYMPTYSPHGQCLENCEYYNLKEQVTIPKSCTEVCPYYISDRKCVNTCENNTFIKVYQDLTCQQNCSHYSLTMVTPNQKSKQCANFCSETNYNYTTVDNRCVQKCPSNIFTDQTNQIFKCIDKCDTNYMLISNNNGQYQCIDKLQCSYYSFNLTINLTTYCTYSCAMLPYNNFINQTTNKCVNTCTSNSYILQPHDQLFLKVCVDKCHNKTLVLQNKSNVCYNTCSEINMFLDSISNKCVESCPQFNTRTNELENICVQRCTTGYFMFNKTCIENLTQIKNFDYQLNNFTNNQTLVTDCTVQQGLFIEDNTCKRQCGKKKYVHEYLGGIIYHFDKYGYNRNYFYQSAAFCVDSCYQINKLRTQKKKCVEFCDSKNFELVKKDQIICYSKLVYSIEIFVITLTIVLVLLVIILTITKKIQQYRAKRIMSQQTVNLLISDQKFDNNEIIVAK